MGDQTDARIQTHVGTLTDPRSVHTQHHGLLDIVTLALCGVLCGAESWTDIEAFGEATLPWLRTFLDLPHGIPSHDTIGRVFAALDADQFQACFRDWVAAVAARTRGRVVGEVVALDGTTLRRSHDRAAGKAAPDLAITWVTHFGNWGGRGRARSQHQNTRVAAAGSGEEPLLDPHH